ncbi:Topoisomerase II [Pseudomonas marincola]|uniref:Topoisomerase II n=2 Tax=Pseudomonas marincola TaxID=437900 RepID=A0A653EA79_9PSED|nr:Topoisomerase II [Pseudomonas marincola]
MIWQNKGIHLQSVSMPKLLLDVSLPAERLRLVYQGQANRIQLKSRDGRLVSIPAHHLRPFIGHVGVQGTFIMEFTESGQLLSLRRAPA